MIIQRWRDYCGNDLLTISRSNEAVMTWQRSGDDMAIIAAHMIMTGVELTTMMI
jgi:hypothetical protein